MPTTPPASGAPASHHPDFAARADAQRRWRTVKDGLARSLVTAGGWGVVLALLMIFAYLFIEVLPLFRGAHAEARATYAAPGGGRGLVLALEEQTELGLRFTDRGTAVFFTTADGTIELEAPLADLGTARITAHTVVNEAAHDVAFGLSDGRVLLVRHEYTTTYPDDVRVITPRLEYPLGETALVADEQGRAVTALALRHDDDGAKLAAVLADGTVVLVPYTVETSFLDESKTLVRGTPVVITDRFDDHSAPTLVAFDGLQQWLFLANPAGELLFMDVREPSEPRLVNRRRVARAGETLTSLTMLGGGISVLVGTSSGRVEQWFPVRDADNAYSLERVRGFALDRDTPVSIATLATEQRRKGFAGATSDGRVGLFYTTSERRLAVLDLGDAALGALAIAPRANALLAEDDTGQVHVWELENEHPEISWSSLWGKVWYESYPEPQHVWQSSAANRDFEPKFSLAPLSIGTLKGALYAMLIAVPLAILGAIYTAYFMTPALRQMVKPAIEVMAALPSVILGFLAGLWLAPFLDAQLPGVFMFVVALPLALVGFGLAWDRLPIGLRSRVPAGWAAALLVPVIMLVAWVAFGLSKPVEVLFFGGNLPQWLSDVAGIDYDQRNSLVVGVAMGFAVIPSIFSIAEDAIFGVPKHLSNGSLALGATPWQTLVGVVLPTASPGIFSAVMIGLGRAVGETMIVLMATGNTPVMDMNIFEGMRTLAANIAVEMPESEVGSTHYRVLCLAALVLFMFTFVLNTAAEVVRQRLRDKYSSI
jgi:phosphate transport system permease protein